MPADQRAVPTSIGGGRRRGGLPDSFKIHGNQSAVVYTRIARSQLYGLMVLDRWGCVS